MPLCNYDSLHNIGGSVNGAGVPNLGENEWAVAVTEYPSGAPGGGPLPLDVLMWVDGSSRIRVQPASAAIGYGASAIVTSAPAFPYVSQQIPAGAPIVVAWTGTGVLPPSFAQAFRVDIPSGIFFAGLTAVGPTRSPGPSGQGGGAVVVVPTSTPGLWLAVFFCFDAGTGLWHVVGRYVDNTAGLGLAVEFDFVLPHQPSGSLFTGGTSAGLYASQSAWIFDSASANTHYILVQDIFGPVSVMKIQDSLGTWTITQGAWQNIPGTKSQWPVNAGEPSPQFSFFTYDTSTGNSVTQSVWRSDTTSLSMNQVATYTAAADCHTTDQAKIRAGHFSYFVGAGGYAVALDTTDNDADIFPIGAGAPTLGIPAPWVNIVGDFCGALVHYAPLSNQWLAYGYDRFTGDVQAAFYSSRLASLPCCGPSVIPPTRQFPRDDNQGISTARVRIGRSQPSSRQQSYRQGFRGTYT